MNFIGWDESKLCKCNCFDKVITANEAKVYLHTITYQDKVLQNNKDYIWKQENGKIIINFLK